MSTCYKICLLIAALCAVLLTATQSALAAKTPSAIFLVDREDDVSGLPCTSEANDCSLRSAIELANAGSSFDVIQFDRAMTVILAQNLPSLTQPVWIYGGNSSGDLDVEIDGEAATNIFTVASNSVWINHLALFATAHDGTILIDVTGAVQGVLIYDNVIGGGVGDETDSCVTLQGHSGVRVISAETLPSGTRAAIYDNIIRCQQDRGVVVSADRVVVGATVSGESAGNSVLYNEFGMTVASTTNATIRDNNIFGNNVGISLAATSHNTIYGNEIVSNSGPGIYLFDDSSYNTIGCANGGPYDTAYRNLIYDNGGDGIFLVGSGSHNNEIYCNLLGAVNARGASLGNRNGVQLLSGAHNNLIGGAAEGQGNQIIGNRENGILINNATLNVVTGNTIGVSSDGASAAPNGGAGVQLQSGATANIIGGTAADSGNVISGNVGSGVVINDSDANLVRGNRIGVSADGMSAVGNQGSGIEIRNFAEANQIGSSVTEHAHNIIGSNAQHGIHLNYAAHDNAISWNLIGLNRTGLTSFQPLPNGQHGIFAEVSRYTAIGMDACENLLQDNCLRVFEHADVGVLLSQSSHSTLGASLVVQHNAAGIEIRDSRNVAVLPKNVSSNDTVGVAVTGLSQEVTVQSPAMLNNPIPIDLNLDGATPNDASDADEGPNTLLNHPEVVGTFGSGVSGRACALCTVEIYSTYGSAAVTAGGYYVGSISADSTGVWSVDLNDYPSVTTDNVSFVTIDGVGNTSEMYRYSSVPTAVGLSTQTANVAKSPHLWIVPLLLLTTVIALVQPAKTVARQ